MSAAKSKKEYLSQTCPCPCKREFVPQRSNQKYYSRECRKGVEKRMVRVRLQDLEIALSIPCDGEITKAEWEARRRLKDAVERKRSA